MSEINSRAVATIEVNGKQVEQELAKLKKKAEDLRDALMQAYKTGDTTAQKNIQKELNKTEKQVRKIQSEMVNVEQTLKRLDKATPKELQQTLRSRPQKHREGQQGLGRADQENQGSPYRTRQNQSRNQRTHKLVGSVRQENVRLGRCTADYHGGHHGHHHDCKTGSQGLCRDGAGDGECPQVYRHDRR